MSSERGVTEDGEDEHNLKRRENRAVKTVDDVSVE